MDSRTRFRNVMNYQPVDHVPWLEEGLRDDVLEKWRGEGMPRNGPESVFTYDRRERIEVNLSLRDAGLKGLVQHDEMPAWRRNLELPLEERLNPDWSRRVVDWRKRQHLLELPIHVGLFKTLGVDNWQSLENFIYLLADAPSLVHEAMDLQGELARRMTRKILAEVDLDCISFAEPIGSTRGPLVGPADYRKFALSTYRGAVEEANRCHVPGVVWITYANARPLLPGVLQAGFNCLWAMETEGIAMDYRSLRKEFGRDLRLIGGIDLDGLIAGEPSIAQEMELKVPELLADGGFIPLADGRVRVALGWRQYSIYRQRLEQMTSPSRI